MLRTIGLIFQNEFRLLLRDRVALFMLLLAPVVIIAVAGFSLGGLYGAEAGARAYAVAVVNHDQGAVARAVIGALRHQPSLEVFEVSSMAQARSSAARHGGAPVVIVIPAGTTDSLRAGRAARLIVYTDPVRPLEANAIEMRLGIVCATIGANAADRARRRIAREGRATAARLDRLAARLKALSLALERFQHDYRSRSTAAQHAVENQLQAAASAAQAQTRAVVAGALAAAEARLRKRLARRREAMREVARYLKALQSSQRAFNQWLAALRRAAGSHAANIPAPPQFPTPPSDAELAELLRPLNLEMPPTVTALAPVRLRVALPKMPEFPRFKLPGDFAALRATTHPTLPGSLTFRAAVLGGGGARINAFDQYVPGFGVTFLLIGMLMGISLGLIDERDWGTLQRLQVSGAQLSGTLIGKFLARFVIGFTQMIVLFAIGFALFGISLGRSPLMLAGVSAAIAFAAAAFGLLIACIARTHDSVMPIGAVLAMAMSAIGGCWWPLAFEPWWMRQLANWLPTTWAMQAYNDLMIRHLPAASALWPSTLTVALGFAYLVVGVIGASRIYR